MPNLLDANGLQLATRDEWVAFYTAKYQQIYGADVNLASNSPDGQMLNINVQVILDLEDLLAQVYSSMDPDNAIGKTLDQRCAINGVERKGGTFTVTDVTLVTDQSLNLYGLDQTDQPVYTVADNAGNQWQLLSTVLGLAAGTHALTFRAALPGAQLTIPNTITVPVTVILGVASINNPTTATSVGINEETDAVFKTRRQKSVSLPSQGYLAGLEAALLNINGVTYAKVFENKTDSTNADGVPSHTIWVIVAGSGAAADVANAIYVKRNAGAGMFGATTFTVTQVDGTLLVVQWDEVLTQLLFIRFTATSINGTVAPNIAAIRAQLPSLYIPGVNQEVDITSLGTAVQEIDPNTLVTGAGFSTGETQILNLSGVAASGGFTVRYNGHTSATINWNDPVGTIQTKVRAVTGLLAANVTGSIASQAIHFDLSGVGGVQGLLTVPTNTLQTVAPAPVVFTYNEGYTDTLSPTTKRNQFSVVSADIIIGLTLLPAASSVLPLAALQLSGLGGYGALVYSILTNVSGGSIDAGTGLYTAGGTPGTDVIKVVDTMGAAATATVTVL